MIGHEFEQVSGVGGGQGSLVCCSPWGCKESDITECEPVFRIAEQYTLALY